MRTQATGRSITPRKARCSMLTQEQLNRTICRISISCAAASPVRHSVLQGKDAALKMGEVLCFLNWRVSPLPKDLRICYLKMYPVSCRMIRGKPSPASSTRFANWGMAWNGWCLTRRITESPSPGGECSLSAFLIKDAPEKYYLTGKQTRRLLYGWQEESKDTPFTTPKA